MTNGSGGVSLRELAQRDIKPGSAQTFFDAKKALTEAQINFAKELEKELGLHLLTKDEKINTADINLIKLITENSVLSYFIIQAYLNLKSKPENRERELTFDEVINEVERLLKKEGYSKHKIEKIMEKARTLESSKFVKRLRQFDISKIEKLQSTIESNFSTTITIKDNQG